MRAHPPQHELRLVVVERRERRQQPQTSGIQRLLVQPPHLD
jgi:hypothetical protein